MRQYKGVDIFEPDEEMVVAWRQSLADHGVEPGPDGYTSDQLWEELKRRGWEINLNVEDPIEAPAEYAYVRKRLSPSSTHSITAYATPVVEALTIVLAKAIEFDEERASC